MLATFDYRTPATAIMATFSTLGTIMSPVFSIAGIESLVSGKPMPGEWSDSPPIQLMLAGLFSFIFWGFQAMIYWGNFFVSKIEVTEEWIQHRSWCGKEKYFLLDNFRKAWMVLPYNPGAGIIMLNFEPGSRMFIFPGIRGSINGNKLSAPDFTGFLKYLRNREVRRDQVNEGTGAFEE